MANLGLKFPKLDLNDGNSIPMLGFGTGTAMFKREDDGKIDEERVSNIKMAIKMGYQHLDCAEVYNTERELGKAIRESGVPRETLFVTTKVNQNIGDIPNAIKTSLKKLQLDYVDLYLIHQPFFAKSDEDFQKAWKAMEEVKKAGLAKSIGVSNYLQSHVEATLKTATIPPSINQIEYNFYLQHGDLLAYHRSKGIAISAFGCVTPATKGKPGPCDDLLAALVKKYYVNESEICLRWCIDQGVAAITTSSKEQRLSDYLRSLTFTLTPKEKKELSQKGDEKHFRVYWPKNYDPNDRS